MPITIKVASAQVPDIRENVDPVGRTGFVTAENELGDRLDEWLEQQARGIARLKAKQKTARRSSCVAKG